MVVFFAGTAGVPMTWGLVSSVSSGIFVHDQIEPTKMIKKDIFFMADKLTVFCNLLY
jgi:hypothetical protein